MTKFRMTSKSAILGQMKNLIYVHQDLMIGDDQVQNERNLAAGFCSVAAETYPMLLYAKFQSARKSVMHDQRSRSYNVHII